mmetsp:Transcript_6189/g.8108  ORF Transcript_6189/g.8108 Transcript_6189/m.8108 type:complete len:126 (-) Transcript_6189:3-380(-)
MTTASRESALVRLIGEKWNPKETIMEIYIPPNEKIFSSYVAMVSVGGNYTLKLGDEALLLLENSLDSEEAKDLFAVEHCGRVFMQALLDHPVVQRKVGDRKLIVSTPFQLVGKHIPEAGFGLVKK